jgi:Tfp pilus assembly protein PilX
MWTRLTSQLLGRGERRGAFLLGLLFALSVALAALAEQRALTLSQRIAPLLRPAGITTLDWRLAQVKIREVEERIDKLTDASSPDAYCCASYWYDPNRNKVMARLRYGSDTANLLTVQELKRRLGQAGQTVADRIEADLQIQDGINLKAGDVEVEFVTPHRN